MVAPFDLFLDGEYGLLLQGANAILADGYGIQGQMYVALLQGSEMSTGFHKGLMLAM